MKSDNVKLRGNNVALRKRKFKKEFRNRVYQFVLKVVKFVDSLSKETSSQIIGTQLLRSGASIGANHIKAQASSSKKDFSNSFTTY